MSLLSKILFLIGTSLLFFSFTYFDAKHMFTYYDLLILLFIIIFVFFIQIIILQLIKNRLKTKIALSIFCTINIISLHLVFIESIHFLPFYMEIIIYSVFFGILYLIIHVMTQSKMMLKFFTFIPLAAIFAMLILNFYNFYFSKNSNIVLNQDRENKIKFNITPNIYFISFESMVPKSIAKKYFKQDNFAYHEILDKEFYKFKNAFTLAFPSKESLNSLLAFDQENYLNLKEKNLHLNFFNGLQESPLLKIFRNNNYEITTFYDNFWFGRHKGKFVDNYVVNESGGKFNTCSFDPGFGLHFKVAFLGYCLINEKLKFKIVSFILNRDLKKTTTGEKILEIMEKNIIKDKPQFLMAHNINPGHTDDYYFGREGDFEKFISFYKGKSKLARLEIINILNFIKEKDPNSILLIYSDHGPKLSYGLELEDNIIFKIHDTFAVYAGIYPKNICKNEILSNYNNQNFVSLNDISKIIINCLNSNKNLTLLNEKQFFMDTGGEISYFNINENNLISYKNLKLRLNNYLYE